MNTQNMTISGTTRRSVNIAAVAFEVVSALAGIVWASFSSSSKKRCSETPTRLIEYQA
ncbi:hypothetical protein [Ponticaulis profundi]|uniref:Uncharacterized protein n=1 Tax=Ponticaulis profundi TaxID=2665222 RepID=A0ABW1S614_9PROT